MYLRRQDVISVPAKGGILSVVDSLTGEFVRELPVPAGCYSVGALVRACRRGQRLVSAGGVTVIERSAGGYAQQHESHFESAANPTYRVTNAMRMARNLEASMRRMEMLERVATKRHEALIRATENVIPVKSADAEAAEPDVSASDEKPAKEAPSEQ